MKLVLAYLLLGSYGGLLWKWRRERAIKLVQAPRGMHVGEPKAVL